MEKLLGISYFGNRMTDHFKYDLDELRESGFNAILHTFAEPDIKYYKDTVAEMVSLSKEWGFKEVYINPWGVCRLFGGEAFSEFTAYNYTDNQSLNTGEKIPISCLNRKNVKEFLFRWIKEAASTGADNIFWDEPHWQLKTHLNYPENWSCRCSVCREKFKDFFKYEMPENINEDVIAFRENSLIDFLYALTAEVKKYNLKNSVCLLPFDDEYDGISQWSRIGSDENLDVIAADPYWQVFKKDPLQFTRFWVERLNRIGDEFKKEKQVWIQGFRYKNDELQGLKKTFEYIGSTDINNIFVWGIKACGFVSYLKPEDPAKTWNIIKNEIKNLAK